MSTEAVNQEVRDVLQLVTGLTRSTDLGSDVRPKYSDGVDAYTNFITQRFFKYDLSDQRFFLPSLFHTPCITGIKEIRWIYQMQSNKLADAESLGVTWWLPWGNEAGEIGKRYGFVVKKFKLIDKLLHGLETNPFGRRHIMDLYDQSEFDSPGLYPCAFLTMWSVRVVGGEKVLDMTLTQRSSDYLVAGWINKSQYAVLQMMIAHSLGMKVGSFAHVTQNLHIYDRHFNKALYLIEKEELPGNIYIQMKKDTPRKSFYDYTESDFEVIIENNIPLERLKLDVGI